MTEFLSFFVVLVAAVFFSALFNRLHLPWVVALIAAGVAIGPFGFNVFEPTPTLEFLGQIGLVFLMFMAGLETRISRIAKSAKAVTILALANGLIPFGVGVLIGWLFGYPLFASLLLGVLFISTSIAVVVPSLEANHVFHTHVGGVIVAATIIEDILSLALLSFLLQTVAPTSTLPLWLLYPILIGVLLVLRFVIPRLRRLFTFTQRRTDLFQQELRLVFMLLIGVVLLFEVLGLHPIIAGFFAGLLLSDSITSKVLYEKIRAISYGLFIPIFFILIGTKTNIQVFFQVRHVIPFAIAVIAGSLGAKLFSGWLGARLAGLPSRQAWLAGIATTPSLTTTLAIAFTGREFGLLDEAAVTVLVLLSVVSILVGPLGVSVWARRAAQLNVLKHPV